MKSFTERESVSKINQFTIQSRATISEEIYAYLRQSILTGDIKNGEKLVVSELANQLNVSRTPLRDSLNRLELEGLIYSVPKSGYVVNGISEKDVDEIIEIRIVTEALAAKWASANITSDELNYLNEIIIKLDNSIKRNKIDEVVKLDTEFHETICKLSGSRRIDEINQRLRDHTVRFRFKILSHNIKNGLHSNEGHKKILNAIKLKDFNKIEHAYREHLSSGKQVLLKVLKDD